MVEAPNGALEPLTLAALTWQYYDDLLDFGYDHAWLLNVAGKWEPEQYPFTLRFPWTVEYVREVHRERWGE